MTIPNTIKVGALTYQIEIVDEINGGQNLGETRHSSLIMKILKGEQSAMEATFLHELFHCFLTPMPEMEVEALSSILHRFIKDNPKVFI